MKKFLIFGLSILFAILLVVAGWLNTLGGINLGKAYQTINLVKLLDHTELESNVRKALYSTLSVYRCELKTDKNFIFFSFTLGSAMEAAQLEIEQIIDNNYRSEALEPASATICLEEQTG